MKPALQIAFLFFVFYVILGYGIQQKKLSLREGIMGVPKYIPHYIEEIPGNLGNYRSAQLTADQLDTILRQGFISTVIRMDSEKEGTILGEREEQSICFDHGVAYIFINAHKKIHPDSDIYLASARQVDSILNKGNVLIHCKHGYDRTGAMVGYHLGKMGFSGDFIVKHNGWGNYLGEKGMKYANYLKTALYNE